MKKIVAVMLSLSFIICWKIPTLATSYTDDYRTWSQGASSYWRVADYGCCIVAMAKMIAETGVDVSSGFNPDVFAEWEANNGYIKSLTEGVAQKSWYGPQAYANEKGKVLNYIDFVSYSDDKLWDYINNGYSCIVALSYSGGTHYVYASNTDSKNSGTLTFYESWSSAIAVGTKTKSQLYSIYSGLSFNNLIVYKANVEQNTHVDIGTDFTALILNTKAWKPIANNNGAVEMQTETGNAEQLWYFERQSDGSYKISSCYDGKCLDVLNFSSEIEATVQTCVSNDTNAQRWFIYENSGGYMLKAKCTECVLDAKNGSTEDGTPLQMYTSNNTSAQIWSIYKGDECKLQATTLSVNIGNSSENTIFMWDDIYGESYYDLKIWENEVYNGDAYHLAYKVNSGYGVQLPAGKYQAYVDSVNYYDCKMSNVVTFTVEEGSVDIGTDFTALILNTKAWKGIENDNGNVNLNKGNGNSKLLWYFERQSDGSYKISSCYDGECLEVMGASTEIGASVRTYPSNDSDAQRWFIYQNVDGYTFRAKCTEYVLDATDGVTEDGTPLQVYSSNNTYAQIWTVYKGDECKLQATTLEVNAGNSSENTIFMWDDIYGESYYDLKIWKNELYNGDAYHLEYKANSGYSIQLPAGTYQAYVDSVNYYDCKMSNVVTFTVEQTAVESITLNKSTLSLTEGDSETLAATVLPEDADDKSVVWMSSDSNVAIVEEGVVKAVGSGTATITAMAGEYSAECIVTVLKKYDYVINSLTGEMPESGSFYVEISVTKLTNRSEKDTIVIAVFEDGAMIDRICMKARIPEGESVEFGGYLTAVPGGELRAFVWDSLTGMKPLTEIK